MYVAVKEELRNGHASEARLSRARARVGKAPGEVTGRDGFCSITHEGFRRRGTVAEEKRREGEDAGFSRTRRSGGSVSVSESWWWWRWTGKR